MIATSQASGMMKWIDLSGHQARLRVLEDEAGKRSLLISGLSHKSAARLKLQSEFGFAPLREFADVTGSIWLVRDELQMNLSTLRTVFPRARVKTMRLDDVFISRQCLLEKLAERESVIHRRTQARQQLDMRRQRALALRDQGLSNAEIAGDIGIRSDRVRRILEIEDLNRLWERSTRELPLICEKVIGKDELAINAMRESGEFPFLPYRHPQTGRVAWMTIGSESYGEFRLYFRDGIVNEVAPCGRPRRGNIDAHSTSSEHTVRAQRPRG